MLGRGVFVKAGDHQAGVKLAADLLGEGVAPFEGVAGLNDGPPFGIRRALQVRVGQGVAHAQSIRKPRETTMKRADLTEKILDIKREKDWKWKYICRQIGGYSEFLIVGALQQGLVAQIPRVPPARSAAGWPVHLSVR